MSDIRNLDINALGKAVQVAEGHRKAEAIAVNSPEDSQIYNGVIFSVAGSTDTTLNFVDGGSITFTPQVAVVYPFICYCTVLGTSAVGIGFTG